MVKLLLTIFIVSNSAVFGQNLTTTYASGKVESAINTYDDHKLIIKNKEENVKIFAYLKRVITSISREDVEKMKQAKQLVVKRSNNF